MSTADFMLSDRQQKMLGALLLHPDRQYGSKVKPKNVVSASQTTIAGV